MKYIGQASVCFESLFIGLSLQGTKLKNGVQPLWHVIIECHQATVVKRLSQITNQNRHLTLSGAHLLPASTWKGDDQFFGSERKVVCTRIKRCSEHQYD